MPPAPTRSLKHEYELFVEHEIENYKESVPRSVLLGIAEDAVTALAQEQQLQLTELLLCEKVDAIIFKRLRLPAYQSWRRRQQKLVEELQPVRTPNYTPLFQVIFALQNLPAEEGLSLRGLTAQPVAVERGTAKFDLTFGHTYSFTVSGLDATGTKVAQSQPFGIELPRAKAALRLSASRFGGVHPLKVQLSATLAPQSLGVAASGRDVVLEAFSHGGWHSSSDTVTGPGGRAAWTFTLGPGVYRLRARFVGTVDLAGATSAPVAVVVR